MELHTYRAAISRQLNILQQSAITFHSHRLNSTSLNAQVDHQKIDSGYITGSKGPPPKGVWVGGVALSTWIPAVSDLKRPSVFRAAGMSKTLSCGRDLTCVQDLKQAVEDAGKDGFDFVQVPLFHPLFKRDHPLIIHRQGPTTRNDTVLTANDWAVLIVAKLSPWIQLESEDPVIRRQSEDGFFQEISLAVHLGVPAILIPLSSPSCVNLSRCLFRPLLTSSPIYWVKVPVVSPRLMTTDVEEDDEKLSHSTEDPWEWWNTLRTLCGNNSKLHLVLEVGSVLPSYGQQIRWLGEPVKAISIATETFMKNRKGFPVLSKKHQEFIFKLLKLNVQVILTGYSKVDYPIQTYLQYLNHLYKTQPQLTSLETYAKGFEEYLQSPLQPLKDNLDSATYEVFEKDPVKYISYENAIAKALEDRIPEESVSDVTCVVMVVGAGRGPLVQASLNAAKTSGRNIRVYAVEKNPGAVNTLLNRQRDEWGERVTVVSSDMRLWTAPEKADILVSELLGSFGDNELSPECLDGAQSFLKSDGVSIPSSYTSHLSPVSSAKLHALVSCAIDKEKAYPLHQFEIPSVVYMRNMYEIAQPKVCFTFEHPNWSVPVDNRRYICLQFTAKESVTMHGFAGYFDTSLYDHIKLSIEPTTYSDGMISWFPIFFPLVTPVYVKQGGEIEVHMWRVCNSKKVWYEWCLTKPIITAVQNPNGRSYWIGL